MRERWLPVGVLAGVLFAVNAVARVVARLGPDRDSRYGVISLVAFTAIGLIAAGTAFVWSQDRPAGRWLADAAAAALTALVPIVFVGPFISDGTPFADGAGAFFAVIWEYAGFVGVGAGLGYLVAIALGRDHRSRSLQKFAESKLDKPRRVIRR